MILTSRWRRRIFTSFVGVNHSASNQKSGDDYGYRKEHFVFICFHNLNLILRITLYSRIKFAANLMREYTYHMSTVLLLPILVGFAAFISTFLGGLFALRFKDRLHLILGFSAGAVIGVAFFDLLPEAIDLAGKIYSVSTIVSITSLGFIVYMILDRVISHNHDCHAHGDISHFVSRKGIFGAGSLSVHSFFDGAAVGLAFHAGAAVGVIVAVAVLTHDFSDGINTINLILKNNGQRQEAFRWLFVDAVAPLAGILSTFLFTLPESFLGLVLAIFSGFFLYIGASDLLPESHHSHPTAWTTFVTVLGFVVLYAAIKLAGI